MDFSVFVGVWSVLMAWLTTIFRALNSSGWSLVIVTVVALVGLGAAIIEGAPG
jgi:hypothetical protein